MSEAIDRVAAMLDDAPLEDVMEALRAASEEEIDDEWELTDVLSDVLDRASTHVWSDAKRGATALRACVDLARDFSVGDGDTATRLLQQAVALDPDDDGALLAYVSAVADSAYRYADRTLLDVARNVTDPERARRLVLVDAIAEWFVLAPYLQTTPSEPYETAMRGSFAKAVRVGGDAAGWAEARAWVLANVDLAAGRIPDDLFARYAV